MLVAQKTFSYDDEMMLIVVLKAVAIVWSLMCVVVGALHKLSYLIFVIFPRGWCYCQPNHTSVCIRFKRGYYITCSTCSGRQTEWRLKLKGESV